MKKEYKIITVATHSEGLLDSLVRNEFNEKIKVLGYGKKWTGFKMKNELIYDYIKNLKDDKIIIYLDGFDSKIVNNPLKAIEIFKKNNYKIVFSHNVSKDLNFIFKKITSSVFPECKNGYYLNSGLYMGYVKYLKIILKDAIQHKCKDDQVVLNKLCKKYNFIDIDYDEVIFKNVLWSKIDKKYKTNTIFISFPGNLNLRRIYRSIFEYMQFFIKYITLLLVLIIICLLKTKRYKSVLLILSLFIFVVKKMDFSCYNVHSIEYFLNYI